jgi:hypothetical protein
MTGTCHLHRAQVKMRSREAAMKNLRYHGKSLNKNEILRSLWSLRMTQY